jgi:hypothetical protein
MVERKTSRNKTPAVIMSSISITEMDVAYPGIIVVLS